MMWLLLLLLLLLVLGFGGLAIFVARAFLIAFLVVLLIGLVLGGWLFRGRGGGVEVHD